MVFREMTTASRLTLWSPPCFRPACLRGSQDVREKERRTRFDSAVLRGAELEWVVGPRAQWQLGRLLGLPCRLNHLRPRAVRHWNMKLTFSNGSLVRRRSEPVEGKTETRRGPILLVAIYLHCYQVMTEPAQPIFEAHSASAEPQRKLRECSVASSVVRVYLCK